MQEIILGMTFMSVFILFSSALKGIMLEKNVIGRIKGYINTEKQETEVRRRAPADYRKGLSLFARGIKNARFLDGYKKKIRQLTIRAHVPLKAEEVITICFFAFSATAFLLYVFSRNFLLTLAGGIAGWQIPLFAIKRRRNKLLALFNSQLGDAVVLISNSLKAGASFIQAIDTVTKEMDGPVAMEFAMMLRETSIGVDTQKALENMAERVKSDDLEILITAVLIQRQTGGNLAEILDNISSTIRDRVRIKNEIKTLTAQGRVSGYIISVLPIALALIIYVINPGHIKLLFSEPLGIAILTVSVLMELIGIISVKRIVKIEV